MCGITGFLSLGGGADLHPQVERMSRALEHRGPDGFGHWVDEARGIALGHRRLAIVDLTPTGHQPMVSHSGRHVISFNGEIYNFPELRAELEALGVAFHGTSDTEIILEAVERWGLDAALKKFVGMFAIALWDREAAQLHLARDRFGEKPLYYGWQGQTLLFGSELKALRAHPAWHAEIDRNALALYARYNYVPAPYTIYQGVFKLPPGTRLSVAPDAQPVPYWSAAEAVAHGARHPFGGSDAEALAELERLLMRSVKGQMMADVPLGAFLSGGIDSSTIVALMQAQSSRPIQTFTIGFHEAAYNEADQAMAVARHLGTAHTELYITPTEALGVVPKLPALYDEPFADSSQIPTHLVAGLARRHVTVSLSGDAGDELFNGYGRYFATNEVWSRLGRIPAPVRAMGAGAVGLLAPATWDAVFRPLAGVLPAAARERPGDRLHKLADLLAFPSLELLYRDLVSNWVRPERLVRGGHEPRTAMTDLAAIPPGLDLWRKLAYLDVMAYLPDDILVKVDRAAMGVSLETRVPLLDHRVAAFAWSLPHAMRVRDGQGKWLLRQLLYQHVPRELVDRPKMGFGVPVGEWLRGPLRAWAEELLDARRLADQGYFDPAQVRQKWQEHLEGTRNWQYPLWSVLMFQAWLEAQAGVPQAR